MPPVRDPSTKPSAATVLPEPVACSNQKRRAAPGPRAAPEAGRPRARRRRSTPRAPANPRARARRPRPRPRPRRRRIVSSSSSATPSNSSSSSSLPLLPRPRTPAGRGSVAVLALDLSDQRREGAGQHVDLVCGQDGAVRETGLVLGQQALEAEHQRVLLAPLDAGLLETGLHLCKRGVQCTPAGGARSQGGRIRRERLTCEPLDVVELIAGWNGRSLAGHFGGLSHFEACRNTWTPSHATAAQRSSLVCNRRERPCRRHLRGPRDREAWLT